MRWPIRNEILVPFAVVQTIAIALLSVGIAWMAIRRAERETVERLTAVVQTLNSSSFPLHGRILEQMKGLSGADFISADATGQVIAATLPESVAAEIIQTAGTRRRESESAPLSEFLPVQAGESRYRVGSADIRRSLTAHTLLVLIPERQWTSIRTETMLPPLLTGGLTLVVMVSISFVLAGRFSEPLRRMQQQVQRIAAGEFDATIPHSGSREMHELATSIQQMAGELKTLTAQIRSSERASVVTQVAGGLAHQLRNSMTGARMAIQLHARRCNHSDRQSLEVAIRQLTLTEAQIRGLLRLTRDLQQPPVPERIEKIMKNVRALMEPICEHRRVRLDVQSDGLRGVVHDSEQVEAALLNLAMNAVEAAGTDGMVEIQTSEIPGGLQIDVLDNGPGVPDNVASRVCDPFITTKPEGVGLGLTLALKAAEDHGGSLTFDRVDSQTRFRFRILTQPDPPEDQQVTV